MGLLTKQGPPKWHPAPDEIKCMIHFPLTAPFSCQISLYVFQSSSHSENIITATVQKAIEYCNHHNINISKLAIQFALSNPEIHTTLMGTSIPEEFQNNLDWYYEVKENGNSELPKVLMLMLSHLG